MTANPLLPEKKFLDQIKEWAMRLGVSERELGESAELGQSQVSKIFHGGRGLLYNEAQSFVDFLISRTSIISPEMSAKDLAVKGKDIVWAYEDELVKDVAHRMFENGYSQILVKDRGDNFKGVVTEQMVLNKLLNPEFENVKMDLKMLGMMKINEAKIIDEIPSYPSETPLADIALTLVNYYAVLITENVKVSGMITRADFLKLVF